MKKLFKDFKDFISRGNVMDMAIGVVLGGAFGNIVTSLVNDIIMPLIAKLLGNVNFTDLKIVLTEATEDVAETAVYYGKFIQFIINFIIIALCIFAVVRAVQKLRRKKEEEPAEEPAPEEPDPQIELLTEIRDLLKK
jgi:large conductance mechanosensitive channel